MLGGRRSATARPLHGGRLGCHASIQSRPYVGRIVALPRSRILACFAPYPLRLGRRHALLLAPIRRIHSLDFCGVRCSWCYGGWVFYLSAGSVLAYGTYQPGIKCTKRLAKAMERTSGSFSSLLSMKFDPQPEATRSDSALPILTAGAAKVHVAPLPAGSIPVRRRSSCSR
jgi:hypothetical protein